MGSGAPHNEQTLPVDFDIGDFEEKSSNHYPNGAHSRLSVCDILPIGCAPLFILKDFIYLFMRDTQRDTHRETRAEGEAGSMQGA